MTEAEQLAKAWVEARGNEWGDGKPWTATIANAQRVIDRRFTPPEPPDPAEQIANALDLAGVFEEHVAGVRRAIAGGWITPGPACEGYVPTLDPLVQAVLDAYDRFHGNIGGVVRALREAQP